MFDKRTFGGRVVRIKDLMAHCGVAFGTSGARGLVSAMTDEVCYAYTAAFLQHLETEGLVPGGGVVVGGDLRSSSPRIMAAVAMAVVDRGYRLVNCGYLPSPAVALYGIEQGIPSIMVTGSHIPDDRNGIKFNKASGEILKADEAAIRAQSLALPDGTFDAAGAAIRPFSLPPVDTAAADGYVRRYLEFLPAGCLAGLRIGLYEHSSVARGPLLAVLQGLGAEVVSLGRSEVFVPVDTEAVRPEDVEMARAWAKSGRFDALVSADGDGDRPLVSDAEGNWLRGDIAGVLCARFLGVDAVVTPVSSNTVAEKSGWFGRVVRTRIGSPFVIEGMAQAQAEGFARVAGYEANGGFLTATAIAHKGRTLSPLPTRDAIIVPLAILLMAREAGGVAALLRSLPARFTASDRVKAFPTESSRAILAELTPDAEKGLKPFEAVFGRLCGPALSADTTDGLRVVFRNQEVVHLRPSGNAPEFRCYVETDSEARSSELLAGCMAILDGWKRSHIQL